MIGWVGNLWFWKRGKEMDLRAYIKRQEGQVKRNGRHVVYECPTGKLTVGWGRNLEDNGISDETAETLLTEDLAHSISEARRLVSNFAELNEVRQTVIISMIHQNGSGGFAKFVDTRAAIERESFGAAAREMLDSKWHRDLKRLAGGGFTRSDRESEMMRTGEWVTR